MAYRMAYLPHLWTAIAYRNGLVAPMVQKNLRSVFALTRYSANPVFLINIHPPPPEATLCEALLALFRPIFN